MRYAFNEAELNSFVSKQAKSPVGMAFGSSPASQCSDLSSLLAVNLWRLARFGLIKESCFETFNKVAALYVEYGLGSDLKSFGNGSRMLIAMKEVEHPGTPLYTS